MSPTDRVAFLRQLTNLLETVWNHGRENPRGRDHWSHNCSIKSLREALVSLLPQPPRRTKEDGDGPLPSSTATSRPDSQTGYRVAIIDTGSPTSHPDILKADIADLLSLIERMRQPQTAMETPRIRPLPDPIPDLELILRCQSHIAPETPVPDPTPGVWILSYSQNEYDQPDDPAFLCVFPSKPSAAALESALAKHGILLHDQALAAAGTTRSAYLQHILNGGGRLHSEHTWYHLKFTPFSEP